MQQNNNNKQKTNRHNWFSFSVWREIHKVKSNLKLTISTASISGRRTAWFPDRPITQAGVSGPASSRATTASTPILLLYRTKHRGSKHPQAFLNIIVTENDSADLTQKLYLPALCQKLTVSRPVERDPEQWPACHIPAATPPAAPITDHMTWATVHSYTWATTHSSNVTGQAA